jgi:pimeloyl-ACP methyl ester carboxylesterase/DNA-binding CsgD family transcriptional regulator
MEAPAVQYVTTRDGYDIAYCVTGSGRPLVFTPNPFNHLQRVWATRSYLTPWFEGLAQRFRLVQLDWRGHGMSQRGLGDDFQPGHMARDIEAVVDKLGLDDFVLTGNGGPALETLRYAVGHPERVAAVVLFSASAEPDAWSGAIFRTLAEENWDLFLRFQAPPGFSSAEIDRLVAYLKATANQDDWLKEVRFPNGYGIEEVLPRLRVPVLLIRPRGRLQPSEEACRGLARRIPGARFISIDGDSPLGDSAQGLAAIELFLQEIEDAGNEAPRSATVSTGLSVRELDVLRLIAAGKSNAQIAEDLVISVNTVIRHVANIFDKLGVASRAEAATYAARNGIV